MKKSILCLSALLLSSLLLVGCTSKGNNNPSGEDESSSSGSSHGELASYTVTFLGINLNPGINMADHVDEFMEFINGDGDYFTSASIENIYTQSSGNPQKTLCVGTKNYGGNLTLNFKYDIASIDFNIGAYYNWDSYNEVYTVDVDSRVTVEGNEYLLPNEATTRNTIPETEDHHIDYASAKKSINFRNNAALQRVYLNSLTINYYI